MAGVRLSPTACPTSRDFPMAKPESAGIIIRRSQVRVLSPASRPGPRARWCWHCRAAFCDKRSPDVGGEGRSHRVVWAALLVQLCPTRCPTLTAPEPDQPPSQRATLAPHIDGRGRETLRHRHQQLSTPSHIPLERHIRAKHAWFPASSRPRGCWSSSIRLGLRARARSMTTERKGVGWHESACAGLRSFRRRCETPAGDEDQAPCRRAIRSTWLLHR